MLYLSDNVSSHRHDLLHPPGFVQLGLKVTLCDIQREEQHECPGAPLQAVEVVIHRPTHLDCNILLLLCIGKRTLLECAIEEWDPLRFSSSPLAALNTICSTESYTINSWER